MASGNHNSYKNSIYTCTKPTIAPNKDSCEDVRNNQGERVQLGDRGLQMEVSSFMNSIRFHVRHWFYHENRQMWIPTKKGVALKYDEMKQLRDALPQMLERMEALERQRTHCTKRLNDSNNMRVSKKLKTEQSQPPNDIVQSSVLSWSQDCLPDYETMH